MKELSELRNELDEDERQILNAIWHYYVDRHEWPYAAVLYQKFDREKFDATLENLGASILFQSAGPDRKRFLLTFLGALLANEGQQAEALLIHYLQYVKERLSVEPGTCRIMSRDVNEAMGLTDHQSQAFCTLLQMSPFANGGSRSSTEWSSDLPPWIDDVVSAKNLQAFFLERLEKSIPAAKDERTIGRTKQQFFLTHSWKDKGFAQRLSDDLRARGLDGFLDVYSVRPGDKIPTEINRGLEACDIYVPILSRAALQSAWCSEEIDAAIMLSNSADHNGRPRIVSVLIEDCEKEMPALLRARRFIHFADRYDEALDELLMVVSSDPSPNAIAQRKRLLKKISFDYSNSPLKHGWRVERGRSVSERSFTPMADESIGRGMAIRLARGSALDYVVAANAQEASEIEFVAKYGSRAVFYAEIAVARGNSIKRNRVWIAFLQGSGELEPNGDGTLEWEIFLASVRQEGDWSVFRVDLNEAVTKTFGRDGWVFKSLCGFRIRGNIDMGQISIFG